MSWQSKRTMTVQEYRKILKQLGLSRTGAGRYFGVSKRTALRYGSGDAKLPTTVVLLVRCLHAHEVEPEVPKWDPKAN